MLGREIPVQGRAVNLSPLSEPSRKLRRFWFMGESGPCRFIYFIIYYFIFYFIFGPVDLDELGQGMEER